MWSLEAVSAIKSLLLPTPSTKSHYVGDGSIINYVTHGEYEYSDPLFSKNKDLFFVFVSAVCNHRLGHVSILLVYVYVCYKTYLLNVFV
jgi:hypothetical protein